MLSVPSSPSSDRSGATIDFFQSEKFISIGPIAKRKRTISGSARRKIAAAQRARWAKIKREEEGDFSSTPGVIRLWIEAQRT